MQHSVGGDRVRPAAAGLFKIAMTFFDAAGTPAGLLGKAYPEVMRLDPRTTRPWLLGVKSAFTGGRNRYSGGARGVDRRQAAHFAGVWR